MNTTSLSFSFPPLFFPLSPLPPSHSLSHTRGRAHTHSFCTNNLKAFHRPSHFTSSACKEFCAAGQIDFNHRAKDLQRCENRCRCDGCWPLLLPHGSRARLGHTFCCALSYLNAARNFQCLAESLFDGNTHDSVENVPQESVRTRLTARSGICISETWGSSIAVIDSGRSEYFTPTHGLDSGLAVTLRLRIRLCFPCPPHVVVSYTIGPGLRLCVCVCVCV